MKLVIAKNQGFCFGGKRAFRIAEKSLKKDPRPIQFLGDILHNNEVMNHFRKKGGKIVLNLGRVFGGTLIISAHGAPFKILEKARNKKIIARDTTCPFVKKNQGIIFDLAKKRYKVIIVGNKHHKEVKGLQSFAKNRALVVENIRQAKKLPKFKKLGVISQTTQSLENFNKISEILKKKAREIKIYNTICPSILVRQKELLEIIKKVDKVLVIGSHLSANTKRLVEISKKQGFPTIWINGPEELEKYKFEKKIRLGIVSGASTPDYLIKRIIGQLNRYD